MRRADVAVLGLGPAGRALAHRLAAHGAHVLAVDPHPQRPWRQTLGGWAGQLPSWLPADVAAHRADAPVLRTTRGEGRLFDDYVVLDNDRLREALVLDGVRVEPRLAHPRDLAGRARVVVDCRGARPLRSGGSAASARAPRGWAGVAQTGYGVVLPAQRLAPLLAGAQAVLMDWRPHDGAASWGERKASFCYLVPVGGGDVLAEETCLAGAPALPVAALRDRLLERLAGAGIEPREVLPAPSEKVHIAMQPARRPAGVQRFGAAGHQLNPISGYSVFASLALAEPAAAHLLRHGRLPRQGGAESAVRELALGALLHLDGDATAELFAAFAQLPGDRQRDVLLPGTPAPRLLSALALQWSRMPRRGRLDLVRATLHGPAPRPPAAP